MAKAFASVGLQTVGAKLKASGCCKRRGQRGDLIENIVELQLFPFESSHLMEGEYIDSLNVSQACSEPCHAFDVVRVVSVAWNQHKANPDWLLASCKPAGKLKHGPNLCP